MSTRKFMVCSFGLCLLAGFSLQAAEKTQLVAKSGSKMRIEGTSNIHDWQVEGNLIGGTLDVGENFPTEPGQALTPGKSEATANTYIIVRGLKSLETDGKPYSDRMDEVMYENMKVQQFPRITFKLEELTLKEAAKAKEDPYKFEAKGDLAVAGVTNKITMPVSITPLGDKKLKINGTAAVKMTDFKIQPPAPKIALGMIKTGDDVKLIFEWMVGPKPASAAK